MAREVLARAFAEKHPAEAARVLERLPGDATAAVLGSLPGSAAAAVLRSMAPTGAAECLAGLPGPRAGEIVGTLPLDAAAALVRRLPDDGQQRVLAAAPPPVADALRLVLRYPEGTAGALMDPRVVALPDDITVGEARLRVRRWRRHLLYYLYVVDRTHALTGVLTLRELMLAAPRHPLASVMRRDVARLAARTDQLSVAAHPAWREFHALPVVDERGGFLGVIRYATSRRLTDGEPTADPTRDPLSVVLTLGELYWAALSSAFRGWGPRSAAPQAPAGGAPESGDGP